MRNILIVLAVLLASCATDPVSTSEATLIPSDRIIAPIYTKSAPGQGAVLFKRDSGMSGAACSIRLFFQGRPLVDIRTGERIELFFPPGEQLFGARLNGICTNGYAETNIQIVAGQRKVYRVSFGAGGELKLQPTAF